MPNGLALAVAVLIVALLLSYVISMIMSLFLSTSYTKRNNLKEIADKIKLKRGDVFADLGCGDGRVVFEVAKRYKDVVCIGYEISPIPLMLANLSRVFLFPFSKRVKIYAQDFTKDLSQDINVVYINWGKSTNIKYDDFLDDLTQKGVRIVRAE